MEVDNEDSFESEYRVRTENTVKYIIISPKAFDREPLSFPIQSLPSLRYDEEWTVARISRDVTNRDLKTSIINQTLAGVKCQWHNTYINCLELEKAKQLTAMAFEATIHSNSLISTLPKATVLVKIAPFEWKDPRIEQETRTYQLLEGSELAPRFLGHIHGNGRVMGFLLEKVKGCPASFQGPNIYETALGKLHNWNVHMVT